MATIISSRLVPLIDAVGGRLTQGFFLVEFRDTGYSPGGENLALSNFFRNIEYIQVDPASGALNYDPRANQGDFPAQGGSGRLQLFYGGSGLITLNISGLPIQILSGLGAVSNFGPASGRIGVVGSGAIAAGFTSTEVISGTAVSGTRAKLHVIGY